jgi:hypothetical protein
MEGIAPLGTLDLQHAIAQIVKALAYPARAFAFVRSASETVHRHHRRHIFGHEEVRYGMRILAFNMAEGWCRDATAEIADEVRRRFVEDDEAPASVLGFIEMANRH